MFASCMRDAASSKVAGRTTTTTRRVEASAQLLSLLLLCLFEGGNSRSRDTLLSPESGRRLGRRASIWPRVVQAIK